MMKELHDLLEGSYTQLIDFYTKKINPLIIAAEKDDHEQRLNVTAVVELRAANEHIMRTHAVVYGVVDTKTIKEETGLDAKEYCIANINKAYAHLCRAGYDAYDCISVNMDREIQTMLGDISPNTLYQVVGNALERVVLKRINAHEMLKKAKACKDVESREREQQQFDAYETGAMELKEVRDLLLQSMPALTDYERNERKNSVKSHRLAVYGIVATIIIGMLGIGLAYLLWLRPSSPVRTSDAATPSAVPLRQRKPEKTPAQVESPTGTRSVPNAKGK